MMLPRAANPPSQTSTSDQSEPLSIRTRILIVSLLSIYVGLLIYSSRIHSPNHDEVAHMVAGLNHWEQGDFSIYRVNPPLIKAIATLPVSLSEPITDWKYYSPDPNVRTAWKIGRSFIEGNGLKSFEYFTIARITCIPFYLLGAIICFQWSRELYGQNAGLLTLVLWCFSPNLLAWGASITPDLGAASLGVTCFYCFWKWLKNPILKNAILAGLALGFALLTKSTGIFLFLYWPVAWLLWNLSDRMQMRVPLLRQSAMMCLILVLGLYLLNLGYGFTGSFKPLGKYQFVSQSLTGIPSAERKNDFIGNRFTNSILADIPVPLPEDYLMGIDIQKRDFEIGKSSYLLGEHKFGGWWYYYLVALTIKVPLGFWILFLLAWYSLIRNPQRYRLRDEIYLLAPALLLFLLVSSQTGFSRYLRYLLPCFPFVFIWMGKSIAQFEFKPLLYRSLFCGSLFWAVLSSAWYFPHSLSYFNELAGGPTQGHHYLITANVDWGQDILLLKNWQNQNPEAVPFYLDDFSFFNAEDAGVEYQRVPEFSSIAQLAPGWYAISVHQLHDPQHKYDGFLNREPDDRIGYSINVYHLTSDPTQRIRQAR